MITDARSLPRVVAKGFVVFEKQAGKNACHTAASKGCAASPQPCESHSLDSLAFLSKGKPERDTLAMG
jgi:hypothetical protein